MAGSWEPLLFRVRRDGSDGYEPTPEQRAAYKREHSQEMVEQLKSLGVNFVMMHCYKGFGLGNERDSMADAVQFSKLCHENGLRVGVYVYSGAFGWELLFPETPEAKDWVVLKPNGDPAQYGSATYRYYWNRNHPAAQAFYKYIVRFAVDRIQTDLIHFDNYSVGPGHDANSIQRFRNYLRTRFNTDTLKRNGIDDVNTVLPPGDEAPIGFLRYAWNDFSCQSLADSYYEMGSYARSLRKDVLLECNPGGVGGYIRSPIDHGRLLGGGEAFWDEGRPPGVREGVLHNRIRTYKTARRMDNIAFAYCTTPLEMAESMAFNLNCLGCVVWFEYGKMVEKPGSDQPVSEALAPYIQFFHTRREIFRDTRVIADVAVLRSFPSQSFADHKYSQLTNEAEQTLIENRIPFQIVYDQHLKDLNPYQVLVLAGCVALSDSHIHQITKFVQEGGHLCLLGSVGIYDEWMTPRKEKIFNDIPLRQMSRINSVSDLTSAIHKASHKGLSMDVQAAVRSSARN